MPTPLFDCLNDYIAQNPLRFHMPGHKGKPLPFLQTTDLAALDVTELPATGNLYQGGWPFDRAQQLWAARFGFDVCQFLTGGSTSGIYAGLHLFCSPGEEILVDRGSHKAVHHLMALLDLRPVYLPRPWLEGYGLMGAISPQDVEGWMELHPQIKTVCITSPNYYGILSDIAGISKVVHARGGTLFVDGAHGAHLPFLGLDHFAGADAVVVSAHKTLPVLGQGALLFVRGIEGGTVRRAAEIFCTSSPSYPILASMDVARAWMEAEGGAAYQNTARHVASLRQRFLSLGGALALDPTRLCLRVRDGAAFGEGLRQRGIYPELEAAGHVLFICTGSDTDGELAQLEAALTQMQEHFGDRPALPPPPLPAAVCSPRQVMGFPVETLPLAQCDGRVAACAIAPYPPGIPVVAPGELISKKELAYFLQIGYNNNIDVQVLKL